MFLSQLSLRNFRNYRNQEICFNPDFNIIYGVNGQGKTNLLESIYYLSVNKSFRTNRDIDLANAEGSGFLIKGIFNKGSFSDQLEVNYTQNGQLQLKVNNCKTDRYANISNYPVVIFSPDDLLLIKEGPSIRRKFINLEASRLVTSYLKKLKDYQRVLSQRNYILKDKIGFHRKIELLKPWDQALVFLGTEIIINRVSVLESLKIEAAPFFDQMSSSHETLSLDYLSNLTIAGELCDINTDVIREKFFELLLDKREEELRRGLTLQGPHLDEIKISINGSDARRYASQGQMRTAVLAIKMGEVKLFKKLCGHSPLILLDDVFSEFDEVRQENLISFLKDEPGQCFVTTANRPDHIMSLLRKRHAIIKIDRGQASHERDRADH